MARYKKKAGNWGPSGKKKKKELGVEELFPDVKNGE